MEDLLTTADAFVRSGPVGGRNLAVVTISGGGCDLAADRADALGLHYPPLGEATMGRLRELLPSYATPQNPLDATAPRWPTRSCSARRSRPSPPIRPST